MKCSATPACRSLDHAAPAARRSWRQTWWGVWLVACLLTVAGQAPVSTDNAELAAPGTAPAAPVVPATTAPPAVPGRPLPAVLQLPSGANVAVIEIQGPIDSFTPQAIQLRVDRALRSGASVIVFELDTPGGELTAAIQASKDIKQIPTPTLAWVNDDAYSAGALLASACDAVVMSPSSAIGDAAPVVLMMLMQLQPTERAKILSPWLAEFRDNARAHDYDYALFKAMCVLGIEVYEVRHLETGETRFVNQADYRVMVRGVSIEEVIDTTGLQPGQIVDDTRVLGASIESATSADVGRWELIRQVHDGSTLLTFSQDEALDTGLSVRTIADRAELATLLGASSAQPVRLTAAEHIAKWLSQMWVRGVLIAILVLGLLVEFYLSGTGFFGGLALIALMLLMAPPWIIGLGQWWHVALVGVGVLLLIAEVFVTPGFGVLGALGLVLVVVGLVFMAIPAAGGPQFGPVQVPPAQRLVWPATILILSLVGVFIAVPLLAWFGVFAEGSPLISRLVLNDGSSASVDAALAAGAAVGRAAMEPRSPTTLHVEATPESRVVGSAIQPGPPDAYSGVAIGQQGVAITALHPSGSIEIDGHLIDALAQEGWVDAGTAVEVIGVSGNNVVVTAA
ncbi:MAG: NfeD family protein [Planctomycetota bacterium]